MPTPTGGAFVDQAVLNLSRDPVSDIAAAALQARDAAGLERADYIILAVPPGEADGKLVDELLAAAGAAPARA